MSHDSTGATVERRVDLTQAGGDAWLLHDGDVVSIPGVKEYVYVSGYVARPGRYPYRADWTVSDYLGEAGGVTGPGNRDHATVLGSGGGKRSADRGSHVERGDTIHINRSTTGTIAAALSIVTNVSALVISIVALTQ